MICNNQMKVFHPVHSNYAADEHGNIYGKNGKIMNYTPRSDGYINIILSKGKRGVTENCYAHVFVYECFNGMYDRKKYEIDHKNVKKDDNKLNNLKKMLRLEHKIKTAKDNPQAGRKSADTRAKAIIRFKIDENGKESESTPFAHAAEAVKATPGAQVSLIKMCVKGKRNHHAGWKWRYADVNVDDDEIWCSLFDKELRGIEVSNLGRVKNKYGKIGIGSKAGNYLRVRIKDSKYLVHYLICLAFHGNRPSAKMTVDHIDRKGMNNNENNLRWATYQQQQANQSRYRDIKLGT